MEDVLSYVLVFWLRCVRLFVEKFVFTAAPCLNDLLANDSKLWPGFNILTQAKWGSSINSLHKGLLHHLVRI